MKLLLLYCLLFLSSCGYNDIFDINSSGVVLNGSNYKYVKNVTGEATSTQIFGIIGIFGTKALVEEAKNKMAVEAELYSGNRALTNITIDSKVMYFLPFFTSRTVYLSADVIEFID
ncbi:MAG: hypothetical protein CMG09_03475 [Candidatus Marinimicrobia bacterium]|nr:hypothetical protein [Candidatus Neomarinimicrobiota bacterium]|tara:strand:- start:641 stop:988 length:348 start_codon:yes stop_codon:yes gene_type:complete